ncbi:IS3 family transposase [Pseudomonas putida]|nr:IS3 family transposase [Pseudomonas putida]
MRYAFVAEERAQFPVRLLCRVMGVSVSGFYDYQHRQGRPDPDAQIRIDLHKAYAASRKTYGRPRLVEALRQQAHAVGHKRIDRLMHEEHIQGRSKGGFRPCTTDSHHALPVASNLLDRQFSVQNPALAWVSDITYIATKEGWLYLAVVLSIQTRQVLGYSLADRMPDDLVERAFVNAWNACLGVCGAIFHSDQGRQYASSKFRFKVALNHLSALTAGPFLSWQKGTKNHRLPSSGPYAALRGPLATGLLPGVRAAGPIHGASALDGHPCPSPPSAVPSLGLLKSQSAAPELSRA